MNTLDGLAITAVVDTSLFNAVSERLGISKALVSKYVGEAEIKFRIAKQWPLCGLSAPKICCKKVRYFIDFA